jgi:hypothetical protein
METRPLGKREFSVRSIHLSLDIGIEIITYIELKQSTNLNLFKTKLKPFI